MKRLSTLVLIASVLLVSAISCTPDAVEVEAVVEQDSTIVTMDSTLVDSVVVDTVE